MQSPVAESERKTLGDVKESLRPGGIQNKKRLEQKQKPDFVRLRGHLTRAEGMAKGVRLLVLPVCSDPEALSSRLHRSFSLPCIPELQ